MDRIAQYHLPGLFEFYELYRVFLPLYCTHRDWFTPGAILPRFTVRRPIACGAADVSAAGMSAHRMRWHWHRNTASRPG